MPPRITQKSHRPRASHRMMVGTLSQRLACAASQRMVSGPRHETTQGRPATAIRIPVVLCGAPGVKNQNPLHEEEEALMQAPIEVSRRGVEKCFCLTSSLKG